MSNVVLEFSEFDSHTTTKYKIMISIITLWLTLGVLKLLVVLIKIHENKTEKV